MALGISIPGTIKQEYLPFTINPGSTAPQTFSFRNKKNTSNFKQLNICPSSLRDSTFGSFFEKDIANQTLFGQQMSGAQVTLDDVFNNLPAIQIREFLPDTRLDQCLNFFGGMISKVWQKVTGGKSTTDLAKSATGMNPDTSDNNSSGSWLSKAGDAAQELIGKIFDYITSVLPDSCGVVDAGSLSGSADRKILQFPFMLYYRLQTCTTTNYYELPCNVTDKMVMQSDGTAGWLEGGRMDITSSTDKLLGDSITSKIIKFITGSIFNNVRINFMPYWDAEKGTANSGSDKVTVQFDLFNDTADSAIANFLFVNTIVPGNRWLQYGMFQHSSNLYDIKLEGLNRLFACAGSFKVTYGGQLRTPPAKLITTLKKKYGSDSSNTENRIKIPDVYHVELAFTSLLPSNFNTYIYQYSTTNNIENCLNNTKQESSYDTVSQEVDKAAETISG